MKTKILALNAVTAAAYAALTVILSPVSYGAVQFRLSELLLLFAFRDKRLCPGLVLGCFIANCFSPTLLYDIPFGTAATVLALFLMQTIRKQVSDGLPGLLLSSLAAGLANGLLVGFELSLCYHTPFFLNALSVFAGETLVLASGSLVLFRFGRKKGRDVRRRISSE